MRLVQSKSFMPPGFCTEQQSRSSIRPIASNRLRPMADGTNGISSTIVRGGAWLGSNECPSSMANIRREVGWVLVSLGNAHLVGKCERSVIKVTAAAGVIGAFFQILNCRNRCPSVVMTKPRNLFLEIIGIEGPEKFPTWAHHEDFAKHLQTFFGPTV